ncbi:MAG: hypothetical protein GY710_07875 [Desulfobacteraceae bacterium]|nr:hypothetical protein [Desulfobacteraceae bacterium]
MSSAVTIEGQTRINQLRGAELPLVIDRMILAMIPGLDSTGAVDRDQQMPAPAYIVHTQEIEPDHKGYVDPDQVVYSIILGSDLPNFSFNWIGTVEKDTDTIITVTTTPETHKRKTDLSTNTTGNCITRNVMLQFRDAQNLTGINITAQTWQFDYQAVLNDHTKEVFDHIQSINGVSKGGIWQGEKFGFDQDHIPPAEPNSNPPGEIYCPSGKFIHPNGTEYNTSDGILLTDREGGRPGASQLLYLMYIGSDPDRFEWVGNNNQAYDWAVAKYEDGEWSADTNNVEYLPFTTNSNDCIIASVVEDTEPGGGFLNESVSYFCQIGGTTKAELNTHENLVVDPNSNSTQYRHVKSSQAKKWEGHADDINLHGQKNLLINGDFDIWQRGTNFNIDNKTNIYTADRWKTVGDGFSGSVTRQEFTIGQTEVPDDPKYFLRLNSLADDKNVFITQHIEDARTCANKRLFLSVWLKSPNTIPANQIRISLLRHFGIGGSGQDSPLAATISTPITNEWKQYKFIIDMPGLEGRTIGDKSSIYPSVGSSSMTSEVIDIANFQLGLAPSIIDRTFAEELALCQSYFFKSYCQDVNPGTPLNAGQIGIDMSPGPASNYRIDVPVQFPVTMRSVPTITIYDQFGAAGCCYMSGGGGMPAAVVTQGDGGCVIRGTNNTTTITSRFCYFHITAEAEI